MSNSIYYKISYVVEKGQHPGGIINMDIKPEVGQEVNFHGRLFKIMEVTELMPATDDFGLLHATCRYIRDEE